jgi:DNA segregation ATPase FtsK/SpoIIIE, S-DNA-T family
MHANDPHDYNPDDHDDESDSDRPSAGGSDPVRPGRTAPGGGWVPDLDWVRKDIESRRRPGPRPVPDPATGDPPGGPPEVSGHRAGVTGPPPEMTGQPANTGGLFAGWVPELPADARAAEPAAVPVDPAPLPVPGLVETARDATRSPVLPAWARSRVALRAMLGWLAGYYGHRAAFHAVRLPVYAGRVAWRAPRGAARLLGGVGRWATDAESAPARAVAIRREDPDMYLKLARQRDGRVRARTLLTVLGALTAVAALVLLAVAAPGWWRTLTLLGAVVGCGLAGGPADRPLIGPAVVPFRVTRLTGDVVTRALESLGIAEINKSRRDGGGITFPAPITRDGPGWRADVDLPYGVTVSDILERRERLASGLRRPVGCVWPEPAADAHAGRLVLWVGDRDMSSVPPPEWPLARTGMTDLFGPVPFGTDPRGRTVFLTLPENNVLVGSLPGAGKTGAVKVLTLAAGLDPTCELWGFNLKGTADLDFAGKFARRYATGMDDATMEIVRDALRDLRAELLRRAETMRRLPRDLCPDAKITRALANRRGLGLHPLVAVIDECQNLFSHPTFGKEAGELATEIIKLGRALGIILILATQRPDAASLPTGVSANVSIRFCLRVMGQTENDMILGTSMYKNGIRATTLRPADKGMGYLVGAADEPLIVRGAYLDGPAAEKIADRARAARIAAGTLAGYAAGASTTSVDVHPGGPSVLDDVVSVLGVSERRVWSETVVARLAELRPDVYGGWGPEQLAVVLAPYGVDTDQIARRVEGKTVNRRGINRQDVVDAVAERNRKRGDS